MSVLSRADAHHPDPGERLSPRLEGGERLSWAGTHQIPHPVALEEAHGLALHPRQMDKTR